MAKTRKTKSTKSRKTKSRKSKSTKSIARRIRSGTLTSFGYNNKLPLTQKQKALCAASKFWGKNVVEKKLQLVSNLNVHKNPALSKKFARDRALVKNC